MLYEQYFQLYLEVVEVMPFQYFRSKLLRNVQIFHCLDAIPCDVCGGNVTINYIITLLRLLFVTFMLLYVDRIVILEC